jgi:hypothetical protein
MCALAYDTYGELAAHVRLVVAREQAASDWICVRAWLVDYKTASETYVGYKRRMQCHTFGGLE